MNRIHLFEFTDLSWYPETLRRVQTGYLTFVATLGYAQLYLFPLLQKALHQAGTDQIVDLCSGGTGPWLRLAEQFRLSGQPVRITLTDKHPHPAAALQWTGSGHPGIVYLSQPIDALHPEDLPGNLQGGVPAMRTLFEGFHHFKPAEARKILQDAADRRAAIGIFEMTIQPPFGSLLLVLSPLMTLVSYFLLTPFIKPRCWQRFLWTYLVPLAPLATCWDGIISLLRVYSLRELGELTASIERPGYAWEMGVAPTGTPVFEYTYLIGYPV